MTSGITGAVLLVLPTGRPRLALVGSLGLLVLPTGRPRFTDTVLGLFVLPAGRPRFFETETIPGVSFLARGILVGSNPHQGDPYASCYSQISNHHPGLKYLVHLPFLPFEFV